MSSEYGIVANVTAIDRVARKGSKAWLVGGTGGEGWHRFEWICRSRSGQLVKKWMPTSRLSNFRCAWIPDHIREQAGGHLHVSGTKTEMEERATALNEFRGSLGRS